MRNELSLLVGLKNNIEYSKNFYTTTRALYPDAEIVFVSYGSTDGTHEWLDSLNDANVIYYYEPVQKTFSDTYNKCTQLATKSHVVFVHNDMVLSPGFIETLTPQLREDRVISYTVVEPPIFASDERPNKLIKDFGEDLLSLNIQAFYDFAANRNASNDLVEYNSGVSFFLCLPRKVLLETGGLDRLFNPMFCEDDDLVLRLRLKGLKFFISLNTLCYHFVSKTSRFSEEYQFKTKIIEQNSNKNFIRKWGFPVSSPVKKKFNTGFIIKNATIEVVAEVEPYASEVYLDIDPLAYIKHEQPNTGINLKQRLLPFNAVKGNDILISLDAKRFSNKTTNVLRHLVEIIDRHVNRQFNIFEKLIGKNNFRFQADILHIHIINLRSSEHSLINLK
ncbi:glycosyltransferase family 2 protein [Mucilaginibacter litoreus]|uniref:Glycosyltransferase family 2 protein n=1 Tax=Mucilaginibacter litoreus TaxID=1048221 RepID=A0ABW3AXQ3_9SPHI